MSNAWFCAHTGCRDFTINAMYYDPATNEVLDFVGGIEDTTSRTLRLTHDNVKRLTEDPLRVLRGVRFATVLGLKLAPGTAQAMKQYAHMCSLNAGTPRSNLTRLEFSA
jgi:tRNA nucleotidyltransferase/poly(A) polymerase